jgi:acyl carrier protein
MNREHQLCGIGELGEIVIRTPFRTLGPVPGQSKTGSFFQKNPYRPDTQKDLYFSGDLGRYRPDGTVAILGRLDEQVKIRGVRIEPIEVMSALMTHPSVHACFVMAREDVTNSPALVAYVVPTTDTSTTASELRSYVAVELPAAMVPSNYVFLEAFPYTPNGKIDRKALPRPDAAAEQHDVEYVAPRTPVEVAIAAIWQQVMKLDRVGLHDNFFDLGGHSLLATQVVARVRDSLHIDLQLRHLFQVPTLKELAGIVEILENSTKDRESFTPDTDEDRSEIVL